MSQRETYNPGLIKWSSELSLTCTPLSPAEVLHSCKIKQTKKNGQMFFPIPPVPPFLWFVLYIVYLRHAMAGECHCVWQRNHNEKQPTCISIGDIISSAVTIYFWAALSPARCSGFPATLPFHVSSLVSPHVQRNWRAAPRSDWRGSAFVWEPAEKETISSTQNRTGTDLLCGKVFICQLSPHVKKDGHGPARSSQVPTCQLAGAPLPPSSVLAQLISGAWGVFIRVPLQAGFPTLCPRSNHLRNVAEHRSCVNGAERGRGKKPPSRKDLGRTLASTSELFGRNIVTGQLVTVKHRNQQVNYNY